jgi:CheY-like chemotaxis protein
VEPEEATVLIVEDGNEYLENLGRFVPGPRYLQAHSGAEAIEVLARDRVDLVYLDMRFDRSAPGDLLGDHAAATREHNGDPVRAWRYLAMNQGLFILDALRQHGRGSLPVILAYDFSREPQRLAFLRRSYPGLSWVSDAVTPEEIRERMAALLGPARG